MSTQLMRTALQPLYEAARDDHLDGHPGLLLQRGLTEHDDSHQSAKDRYIERVCQGTITDLYRHTYDRWKDTTADETRFRSVVLKIESRCSSA